MLGIGILVAANNVYMLIPLAILVCAAFYLRSGYIITSKRMKQLEGASTYSLCVIHFHFCIVYIYASPLVIDLFSIARSPVFSHINASLNGLTTLRVSQMDVKLMEEFDRHQVISSFTYT